MLKQMKSLPKPQDHLHPELTQRLRGGLSDHALKMYSVTLNSTQKHPLIRLNGLIYNMMMKAVGLEYGHTYSGIPFANNPLLITETDPQYIARKTLQLSKLFKLIKDHHLDYAFLQEADFIFPKEGDSPWLQSQKIWLTHFLLNFLNQHYYGIIFPSLDDAIHQQELVTLYNRKTFRENTEMQNQGVLYSEQSRSFRAYQGHFIHNQSGIPISLINMHLHYQTNYNQHGMLDKLLSCDKIMTIMGGDANHAPNAHLDQLFVGKQATNIGYKKNEQGYPLYGYDEEKSILTLNEMDDSLKSFDGICAYAPEPYCVGLQEYGGDNIMLCKDGGVDFSFSPPDLQAKPAFSIPGKPYKNEKYKIKMLNEKIGNPNESLATKSVHALVVTQLLTERENRKSKAPIKLLGTLNHYLNFVHEKKFDDETTNTGSSNNIASNKPKQ